MIGVIQFAKLMRFEGPHCPVCAAEGADHESEPQVHWIDALQVVSVSELSFKANPIEDRRVLLAEINLSNGKVIFVNDSPRLAAEQINVMREICGAKSLVDAPPEPKSEERTVNATRRGWRTE